MVLCLVLWGVIMNNWFSPRENAQLLQAMAPRFPLLYWLKEKAGEVLFIITIMGAAFGFALLGYAVK